MHRYALDKPLGEGAFGDVHLARDRTTGEQVAIKTFKDRLDKMKSLTTQPEVKALRALKHSSIIHCKEYIFEEKSRRAHLVFEFMDMGSLERVCRLRTTPFTDAELRSIVYQVLCGLEFMHRQGFIHRDIKPENILMKTNEPHPIVKLADLGLAKFIGTNSNRPRTAYVATRWYRSPELLLRLEDYGPPSDIWAVGAVLAEMVNLGDPLMPGSSEHDQLRRTVQLRGHPEMVEWEAGIAKIRQIRNIPYVMPSCLRPYVPGASEPVLQLIEDMLELNPLLRPTASEALCSSLFRSSPERPMTEQEYDDYEDVELLEDEITFYAPLERRGTAAGLSPGGASIQVETLHTKRSSVHKPFYIPPSTAVGRSGLTYMRPKWSPAGNFKIP